ncbi:MAG: hypothetical protein LIP23_09150, partial [Planctomycetes bacterium]|nr:hypothetical protein [Planctomycetota bacterium]
MAARFKRDWQRGRDFLHHSPAGGARSLPWYLILGDDTARRGIAEQARLPGIEAIGSDTGICWTFGQECVWLDPGDLSAHDGEARWRAFSACFSESDTARLAGVAICLDAVSLLTLRDGDICARASAIRTSLDAITRWCGCILPVYVLVDSIDCLNGTHALAAGLDNETMAAPLGKIRTEADQLAGEFALATLEQCRRQLRHHFLLSRTGDAAGLSGSLEMEKLAAPVTLFCSHLFADSPYQKAPYLRGLFLGSSGINTDADKSLNDGNAASPAKPDQQCAWFWRDLLEFGLARDTVQTPRIGPVQFGAWLRSKPGLAGYLAGTVLLCWLLSFSYFETAGFIKNFTMESKGAAEPVRLDQLLQHIRQAESMLTKRWTPDFSLINVDAMVGSMRQKYVDAYLAQCIKPALAMEDESADRTVATDGPVAVGNALASLASMR